MAKRYLHEICVNAPPKRAVERRMVIGKGNKEVVIRLACDKISVRCDLSTKQEPGASLSAWSPVLARGLKAAMLLHILLYGRQIKIRKLFWQLGNGELTEYPLDGGIFVYSLLPQNSSSSLSSAWKRERVIHTVLELSQREKDYRLAALHAYLMGKWAESETERFFYLWMAMNGLYDYCYEIRPHDNPKKRACEADRIGIFQQEYAPQTIFLSSVERGKCFEPLNRLIFRTKDFLREIRTPESPVRRQVCELIREHTGKDYSIDAYYYYLLQQTYTYRCMLFHANHPLKLLSYAEESEIILLRTYRSLMEEFLDRALPRWFASYPEIKDTEEM